MKELLPVIHRVAAFIADNFVNIITFFLTVLTAVFATLEFREHVFDTRVRRFILSGRALGADENRYTDSALNYYRRHPQGMTVEYLVYRPEWIKPMLPIENIRVSAVPGESHRYAELTRAFSANIPLPLSVNDLSENARLYLESNMFDHPTIGIREVEVDPCGIHLSVCLGGFYDYYNTCTCFSFETAYEMLNYRRSQPSIRSIRSQARFGLLRTKARFAAIGIDTMSVFVNVTDSDLPLFLLHKRSNKVATAANLISVIPSGYYQPDSLDLDGERDAEERTRRLNADESIKMTILREFAEELCGKTEFSDVYTNEDIKNSVQDSEKLLKNIFYLGGGFDALSTHFELMSMNVIDVRDNPIFGDSRAEILSKLSSNYESKSVFLCELSRNILRQYISAYNSTPVLRQMLSIIEKNYDFVMQKLNELAEQGKNK